MPEPSGDVPSIPEDAARRGLRGSKLADWRTGGLADWRTGGLADWRTGGLAPPRAYGPALAPASSSLARRRTSLNEKAVSNGSRAPIRGAAITEHDHVARHRTDPHPRPIRDLPNGTAAADDAATDDRAEAYRSIGRTPVQFKCRHDPRGPAKRRIEKATGFSRTQVARLLARHRKTGRIRDRRGKPPAETFERRYANHDAALPAEIAEAFGQLLLAEHVPRLRRRMLRAARRRLRRPRPRHPQAPRLPHRTGRLPRDRGHARVHRRARLRQPGPSRCALASRGPKVPSQSTATSLGSRLPPLLRSGSSPCWKPSREACSCSVERWVESPCKTPRGYGPSGFPIVSRSRIARKDSADGTGPRSLRSGRRRRQPRLVPGSGSRSPSPLPGPRQFANTSNFR